MEGDEHSRWIIGETLETIGNPAMVSVVHADYPRLIGTLQSQHGQIELSIQWSETQLTPEQQTRLRDDVMRYYYDYNVTAYGCGTSPWSY